MARKLLVVTTVPVDDRLRDCVREHVRGEEPDVRVVAPASDVSPLDWLATDEDEAREKAARRAHAVGEAVAPRADGVEEDVGDVDPVQAVEDALRTFPADELLLVTRPEEKAGWLEEGAFDDVLARFDLPVTRLVVDGD
jgi:hypothetical protein